MGRRPVVGITPGFMRDKNRLFAGQGYVDGINKAGGLALVLPLVIDEEMAGQILDTVDGILFTGGPDIDARYFGEENRRYGGEISPQRDSLELLLAGRAIEANKPVMGICRGIQLLNVALSGTLYQDIYTGNSPEKVLKHWQEAPDWYPVHDVQIVKNSLLHNIYNATELAVNSYHHQAVKEIGMGLSISAAASDGIVEAVESTAGRFILGVQWHPEMMWQENPVHLKLFEAFAEACRA